MQDGIKGLHMIMQGISCIIHKGQGHSLGKETKIYISDLSFNNCRIIFDFTFFLSLNIQMLYFND